MPMKFALIVDDEIDICELISDTLTENGYKTVVAKDGTEALFKMEKQSFQLLITDLKMPKMGGIELIDAIKTKRKKDKKNELDFPIIVMSGNLAEFKSSMALIDDLHILEKPFKEDDLLEILENLDGDTPIKILKGTDPESIFKATLNKFSEGIAIVCKEKPTLGKVEVNHAPFSVEGQVLQSYFLKMANKDCQMHLGITSEWANAAAKAMSGGEENQELPEDRILFVIRQLTSAILNKVIKGLNARDISTRVIDQTMFFNFQKTVYGRVDPGYKTFSSNIESAFGDLNLYFSFNETDE